MKDSKKIIIRICSRNCDKIFAKLLGLKHLFIVDEYNNTYEFSRNVKETEKLTRWYLENNPSIIKIKELKINRKLFYRVVRIQRRITRRREYSLLRYNCQTYVNSILINLSRI